MPYKNIEDKRRNDKEYDRKRREDPEHRKRKKKANRKQHAFIKLHFPWLLHWQWACVRCNNPNDVNYKYYGGKGIRMLLTKEEIRRLYIRDRAWESKQPTIDRIDPDGDYCLDNCRFIEMSENLKRRWEKE